MTAPTWTAADVRAAMLSAYADLLEASTAQPITLRAMPETINGPFWAERRQGISLITGIPLWRVVYQDGEHVTLLHEDRQSQCDYIAKAANYVVAQAVAKVQTQADILQRKHDELLRERDGAREGKVQVEQRVDAIKGHIDYLVAENHKICDMATAEQKRAAAATCERDKLRDALDEALGIDWDDYADADAATSNGRDAVRIDKLFEMTRDKAQATVALREALRSAHIEFCSNRCPSVFPAPPRTPSDPEAK